MDMDEIKTHLLENGIDMDAKDFMEKGSDFWIEVFLQEFLSRQGLSYVSFCLLVLISSTSICIFLVSKSSKRLVLLALLWLVIRSFFEVKKWNNKIILCYGFGCLIMVMCLCLRFEYIYGCGSRIWDIGIVGMARNKRYSSLRVGRNSLVSLIGCRNLLIQWWHITLGDCVFLLLAFVIMDYPIVSVCCCWGRVSSIYIIYVPCSGKYWCIRYGAADFFVKNSLRGVDWPFIYVMVREVFGLLVSLNQDQSQLRWKGLYCYIYAMRGDGFLPHQGDSGEWYFGQINWLEKEIGSDDRVFCSRHIVCDFGRILDRIFYLIYGIGFALIWRLNVKNRFVFVASFWLFLAWLRLQRKEDIWTVEIGYHYTHLIGSSEHTNNNFFKCGF
ncbi:unnamed protein product [Brassica oleracea var. botrytis]|uniref:(rape) hypothetical protein n=1 Tax=Brassica napus TaxID=3708 RepID=A0A816QM18_BRANA|nr:unnamed protein product [Brassica napus]